MPITAARPRWPLPNPNSGSPRFPFHPAITLAGHLLKRKDFSDVQETMQACASVAPRHGKMAAVLCEGL